MKQTGWRRLVKVTVDRSVAAVGLAALVRLGGAVKPAGSARAAIENAGPCLASDAPRDVAQVRAVMAAHAAVRGVVRNAPAIAEEVGWVAARGGIDRAVGWRVRAAIRGAVHKGVPGRICGPDLAGIF